VVVERLAWERVEADSHFLDEGDFGYALDLGYSRSIIVLSL
jgi:hypothetical protein